MARKIKRAKPAAVRTPPSAPPAAALPPAPAPKPDGAADTVYVSFNHDINPISADALIQCMNGLARQGVAKVCLMLSTGGGSVPQGMTIYNALSALPIELTTYNMGNVNSIGNVIFLAGRNRYASSSSSFMFHGIGVEIRSPTRMEERDLLEKLEAVRFHQKLVGSVISARTRISEREAHKLFLRSAYMSAAEARRRGILHQVKAITVPPRAKLIHVTPTRDKKEG